MELEQITKAEWNELSRQGYALVSADGQAKILRWIPMKGTCLVPVIVVSR